MRPSEGLTVELMMLCKHTVKFSTPVPLVGEEVYCRRCQRFSIVDCRVAQVTIRCGQCTLGRGYGADQDGASRAASRHVIHSGHTVQVRKGGQVLETIGPSADQSTLSPYDTVIAARLSRNKPQIGTPEPLDKAPGKEEIGHRKDRAATERQTDGTSRRWDQQAGDAEQAHREPDEQRYGATEDGFPF